MKVHSAIFDVPTTTGAESYTISGIGTPVAVKIVLVGTDATDGYDDNSIFSVGFFDGTTRVAIGTWRAGGVTSTQTARITYAHAVTVPHIYGADVEFYASTSSFVTDGVSLTWAGTMTGVAAQMIITFYCGTDVSAKADYCVEDEHVEDVGFELKLMYTGCVGSAMDTYGAFGIFSMGIVTNGTNGVFQGFIGEDFLDAQSTSTNCQRFANTRACGQIYNEDVTWTGEVQNIDSSGFNFESSAAGTDVVIFLALDFDQDVDGGYSTVPTSGDISITDPGFTPLSAGVILSDSTTLNTVNDQDSIIGIGEYDDSFEGSISIAGEDGVTTTDHTSVHSSNILHGEDHDQTDVFDASFDAFTTSGFDLTVNTNPTTATYYLWYAIEEEDSTTEYITGSTTTTSTVSGDITGRARISGGTGLGADLKDGEEINDADNWTPYGTASITQIGALVNIEVGSDARGGYIDLDSLVLTAPPNDGVECSIRGIIWAGPGSFNVTLHGSTTGELDSVAVSSGEVVRFNLTGTEEAGGVNNIELSGASNGQRIYIFIYSVSPVVGSTATGDLTDSSNALISGTVNGSSSVTGVMQAKGSISGTANGSSSTTGHISATVPVTGSITTTSTVSANVIGRGSMSGTVNALSSVSGDLIFRAQFTQNGDWVNVVGGSVPTAGSISLDTNVLTSAITDGKDYAVRGVAWSVSGAMNVTVTDEDGTQRDSVAIASGQVKYFQLTGPKLVGDTPKISFSGFDQFEELNIKIFQVGEVVGSIVTGDAYGIEGNWMFGTANGSSTVTGRAIAYAHISGSASGVSALSAVIVAKGSISGTINASSSVSARHTSKAKISGTINASSEVTGYLELGKIRGNTNGFSTVSAKISAKGVLSGTVSGISVTQGAVYGRGVLSGTINGSSSAAARLSTYVPISGTANGSSVVTASLINGASSFVTMNGSSVVTGAIVGRAIAATTINAGSTVSASLSGKSSIVGTINAGSIVTADLTHVTHTEYISGSTGGSSSVTAAIDSKEKGQLSGTVNTYSSVTAFHNSRARLTGSINAGSSVAGWMLGRAYLSGTFNGSSTVSGHVQVIQYISGSVSGSSIVTGKIRSISDLSGTISGSSSAAGALTHKPNHKAISGTINTGSTVAGSMIRYALASGTINGASIVTAAIRRNIPISGTIASGSTVSAYLTKKERSHISGSTSGATTATAYLIGRFQLSGSIQAGSIVTGSIQAGTQLSGTISGTSVVTAKIRAKFALSGSVFTNSTVAGSITIKSHSKEISGTITTGSTVLGVIHGRGQLQGYVNAESKVDGHLSGRGFISGTILGVSSLAGAVRAVVPISGVVNASSSATANLTSKTHKAEISGSVQGSSSVSGQLKARTSGSASGSSTVSGKLVGRAPISTTVASNSSISGTLKGLASMSATVSCASIVEANLNGVGLLGGSTVSRSMVLGILRAKGVELSELIDGFVLEDIIKASIFEEDIEGRVWEAEYKMVAMDPSVNVTIDEPDLKFKVIEDTFNGIVEDEETFSTVE